MVQTKLLGLTKKEALQYLHENNINYQILKEDDTTFLCDKGFITNRYNLSIENDKVVKVEKF